MHQRMPLSPILSAVTSLLRREAHWRITPESQTAVTLCNMFNKDSPALHDPLKLPHCPYTQWQILTVRWLCALWDTKEITHSKAEIPHDFKKTCHMAVMSCEENKTKPAVEWRT